MIVGLDAAQVPIAGIQLLAENAIVGQAKDTDQFYRSKPGRYTDTQTDKVDAKYSHRTDLAPCYYSHLLIN